MILQYLLFILFQCFYVQLITAQDDYDFILSILPQERCHDNSGQKIDGIQLLFDNIVKSKTFKELIWQKRPLLISHSHHKISDNVLLTMEKDIMNQLVRSRDDLLSKVALVQDSWFPQDFIASHSSTEGLKNDIINSNVTIHLDQASIHVPKLSSLTNMTDHSFGLPSTINTYISPPHLETSTPPHTDEQDVFILQVTGSKRWRIYRPLDAGKDIKKDPFNRGKVGDILDSRDLELITDIYLDVGDVLYIPKGFPHETDTLHVTSMEAVGSLHLTIGIDSHFYGLTYAHLRSLVLTRAKLDLGHIHVGLDGHWDAMKTLPLGFLSRGIQIGGDEGNQEEVLEAMICSELKRVMHLLEPKRWKKETVAGASPLDKEIHEAIRYITNQHLPFIMNNQGEMLGQMISMMNDASNIPLQEETWRRDRLKIMREFYKFGRDEFMMKFFEV